MENSAEQQEKTLDPKLPEGLCYVARQPILDDAHQVFGYELLFRDSRTNAFRGDYDLASLATIDHTVAFGLDRLAAGATAFVNCTAVALTGKLVKVLPAGQTVLEILESVEPTPAIIDACKELKESGFRIALDDFVWKPGMAPLVALADYVKIDFLAQNEARRQQLLAVLEHWHPTLIAEKVETQEQFFAARAEGFTLFQGYYFCRPTMLKNHKVPANRISQLEILRLLRDAPEDHARLTEALKRDASLTYRLLRLINSPVCTPGQHVRSIEAALLIVGDETFRRIVILATTSEICAGRPAEILRMAFLRGRFCELAAERSGFDATEQYLLGLLSLLPAMVRLPMEALLPSMPLRPQIGRALLGDPVDEGALLHWILCHEYGDWSGTLRIAAERGWRQEFLMSCCAEATLWADRALHFA